MENQSERIADKQAAWHQTGVATLLLLVIAAPLVAAQVCVRHDEMLLPGRLAEWKQLNGQYMDCRFYGTLEERFIYDELPKIDYSHGGVYFIGESQIESSLALWALPPAEQKLIHNFALSQQTLTQQRQFVRYLMEDENLAAAGGEKSLFVCGLFFGAAAHRATMTPDEPDRLWPRYFREYGLYTYDRDLGLRRVPMSSLRRTVELASIRDGAFFTWATMRCKGENLPYLRPVNPPNAKVYQAFWTKYLGPDWEPGMDREIEEFARMIDELRGHGARVAAVYLPQGSWLDGFAPSDRYREKVFRMLNSKSVPITDLSHRLRDDEFVDSVHFNYTGVNDIQPALMEVARRHLRSTGALP